jgi:hypothetical protein
MGDERQMKTRKLRQRKNGETVEDEKDTVMGR